MASMMSVAFVDSSVAAHESLVQGLKPGIQVHILDANQDGILAITEFCDRNLPMPRSKTFT
ncbi:MAG: DUF4347 domain-containing protein [Synechococcales cyanobacterium CRU_2_2]|nr:DUF4347 domain-containing protein [Synechococcales cyanobacterium CRU_2_2]